MKTNELIFVIAVEDNPLHSTLNKFKGKSRPTNLYERSYLQLFKLSGNQNADVFATNYKNSWSGIGVNGIGVNGIGVNGIGVNALG